MRFLGGKWQKKVRARTKPIESVGFDGNKIAFFCDTLFICCGGI
jgi:hypothetical protein